jgi:hypothetical protein
MQIDELTETQAIADADAAAAEAAAEGFPSGAIIYLDVEATDEVSAALTRYVRNFVARLSTGRYRPGVYCHVKNAPVLAEALDVPRRAIPFWVAGGSSFSLSAGPADSGVAFATLWQGLLDEPEPTATVSLTVDVSTSSTPTPSGF